MKKVRYSYSRVEIDRMIETLIVDFEAACETYQRALNSRESNRSTKELLRGNARGTNIHKFQSSFAWMLHDMKTGPICQVEDNRDEAETLIKHINNISDI